MLSDSVELLDLNCHIKMNWKGNVTIKQVTLELGLVLSSNSRRALEHSLK